VVHVYSSRLSGEGEGMIKTESIRKKLLKFLKGEEWIVTYDRILGTHAVVLYHPEATLRILITKSLAYDLIVTQIGNNQKICPIKTSTIEPELPLVVDRSYCYTGNCDRLKACWG